MLRTIEDYMTEYNMIAKGDRIVLGVSGGADSVCLFHVLLQLATAFELSLFVVHVNHGIRGEEAEKDEMFVKNLCENAKVPFWAVKADIPYMAKKEGLTEEEAGRKVRYEAFNQCLNKNKCNKIAIAHNKNDNAETMLFHLFRGSSIKGLTGINPKRDVIIRPLLCVTRQEIEDYLKENKINFCTDRTNLTEDYSRNKIRHRILAYAQEEINAKAVEHMAHTANQLRLVEKYLEKNVELAYDRIVISGKDNSFQMNVKELQQEDPVIQQGIIQKVFYGLAGRLKDIDAVHIELVLGLLEKEVGKQLHLPYGIQAVKGYEHITMSVNSDIPDCNNEEPGNISKKKETTGFEHILKIPGETYISEINHSIRTRIIKYKKNLIIPKDGYTKWFDYDKINNTVVIRSRNSGDYIQIDSKKGSPQLGSPQGVSPQWGRKKIKSLFIDKKVPREERDSIPLLADGNHIMWVIGDRISEAYKVNEDTKAILEISLNGGNEMDNKVSVLISEEEVAKKISELGKQISKDYEGKEIHLICVLKGGVFITVELAKHLTIPVSMDFMAVSSYGDETISSGRVKIIKDLDESIEGKDVLLVEDIIDSGTTLAYLLELIKGRKPKSIKLCTLLDKPERRVADVNVDYIGFQIPDKFVVGYGLDYAQKFRNLPYIGVIE
nr:hypoxanthine phosphoribosyltransferase [uncultured Anaerocolumna sp.]